MTRHRLHSRVKTLERKARRWSLGKRWAWVAVEYPADSEIEHVNEARTELAGLQSAFDALNERAAKWRARPENKDKPGMPLKKAESRVLGDMLHCLNYLENFWERFPHLQCGDVPCRVVHGDPEILAKPPPGTSLILWKVFEPVLSPEDTATKAEHEARRQRALDAADETAPVEPPTADTADSSHSAPPQRPLTDDELRRQQARESFARQTGEWSAQLGVRAKTRRGVDHAPSADQEFRQARREGRVRVRGIGFFGSTTPRGDRR